MSLTDHYSYFVLHTLHIVKAGYSASVERVKCGKPKRNLCFPECHPLSSVSIQNLGWGINCSVAGSRTFYDTLKRIWFAFNIELGRSVFYTIHTEFKLMIRVTRQRNRRQEENVGNINWYWTRHWYTPFTQLLPV